MLRFRVLFLFHPEEDVYKRQAVISTAGNITQEQERGIRDGLARDFGIEEQNCQLLMGKDEQTTLAGDSASGPFTDGNRISHIENRD